jgi:hypothetical protein
MIFFLKILILLLLCRRKAPSVIDYQVWDKMKKILLFLICFGLPSFAEPVAAPKEVWKAIGLLEKSNHAVCYATLVANDMAITAGHCVKSPKNDVGNYEGWYFHLPNGNRIEVIDTATIPGFDYAALESADVSTIREDVAILKLKSSPEIAPVNILGFDEAVDSDVWVPNKSYWEKCHARQMPPVEVFHISCGREKGYSGAPILRINQNGIHIIGVVSANDPIEGGVFAHAMETTLGKLAWNKESKVVK